MDCHQAYAAEQAARHSACNDRRVLNGTFWVLRSGAPWRDLPETYAPRTKLQSLRSLAAGWRLGPDHGCTGCWRLLTRSGRSNTPRCAVLLLVPASASAFHTIGALDRFDNVGSRRRDRAQNSRADKW